MATLRVVTWNIRAAIGPGPFPDRWWRRIDADRLRAIGVLLSGLRADVIALQEVALISRDGELVDNAGDLGRQLGLAAHYGAVRTFDVVEDGVVRGAGLYGNAILAPRALAEVGAIALPRADVDALVEPVGTDHPLAGIRYRDAAQHVREARALLVGTLAPWRIATTHFSHIGSGERHLQAAATVAALDGATPAVVLGDLNAPIEAPELAPFATWTEGFSVPPGDTARITTDDGYRIDHVLARGASVRSEVVRDSRDLSDHFPVVADLTA